MTCRVTAPVSVNSQINAIKTSHFLVYWYCLSLKANFSKEYLWIYIYQSFSGSLKPRSGICCVPFCSWMNNIHELRGHSGVSRWRSLTHSILINLFIKSGLNNFFPTSPAKYCFCPRVFSRFSTRRF